MRKIAYVTFFALAAVFLLAVASPASAEGWGKDTGWKVQRTQDSINGPVDGSHPYLWTHLHRGWVDWSYTMMRGSGWSAYIGDCPDNLNEYCLYLGRSAFRAVDLEVWIHGLWFEKSYHYEWEEEGQKDLSYRAGKFIGCIPK